MKKREGRDGVGLVVLRFLFTLMVVTQSRIFSAITHSFLWEAGEI